MNELDVERETSTDVTVYLDGYHVLSNDEARRLIFNLALHVWPELSEKNALRLLANEALTKRNAELEAQAAKMRALLLEYRARAEQNSSDTPRGCDSQAGYREEIAAIDAALEGTK